MSRRMEEALDRCMDRVARGESAEEALSSYPGLRAELEPMLRLAAELSSLPKVQAPERLRTYGRPAFRPHRAKAGWLSRVLPERLISPSFGWGGALSRAAAVFAVSLLFMGGTVVASANSLPEDPLYPVKLAAEKAQLALTSNPQEKMELRLRQADRRLAEVEEVARRGNGQAVEKGLALYQEEVDSLGEASPDLSVAERTEDHLDQLKVIRGKLEDRENEHSQAVAALSRVIAAQQERADAAASAAVNEEKAARQDDRAAAAAAKEATKTADKDDKKVLPDQAAVPGDQDPAGTPGEQPSLAPGRSDKDPISNPGPELKGQGQPPADPGNARGAKEEKNPKDAEATPAPKAPAPAAVRPSQEKGRSPSH